MELINKLNSCRNKIKRILATAWVCLFFVFILYFQTEHSEMLLLNMINDVEIWDRYFEVMFYGFFTIVFGVLYYDELLLAGKKLKIEYLDKIAVSIAFIIFTTVVTAIVLSAYGIGDSNNQEMVDNAMISNPWIYSIVVILIGPFVEEMVFRGYLYGLFRGNKTNFGRIICAIVLTSFIFMIYHCSIYDVVKFDRYQLLSMLPIFFTGLGLAYVRECTSNIICPLVVHMVINLVALT